MLRIMLTSIDWLLLNAPLRIQFTLASSKMFSGHSGRYIMMVNCHRLKVSTSLAQTHRALVSNLNRSSLALELWGHGWNINLYDDLRGVKLSPGVNADWTRLRESLDGKLTSFFISLLRVKIDRDWNLKVKSKWDDELG